MKSSVFSLPSVNGDGEGRKERGRFHANRQISHKSHKSPSLNMCDEFSHHSLLLHPTKCTREWRRVDALKETDTTISDMKEWLSVTGCWGWRSLIDSFFDSIQRSEKKIGSGMMRDLTHLLQPASFTHPILDASSLIPFTPSTLQRITTQSAPTRGVCVSVSARTRCTTIFSE